MRINGLGFQDQMEPPSSDMLAAAFRPYVETCIEAFGTSRSMFESNFPVDKASYGYAVFWNACKLLAKGASVSERVDLFAGTATCFIASTTSSETQLAKILLPPTTYCVGK